VAVLPACLAGSIILALRMYFHALRKNRSYVIWVGQTFWAMSTPACLRKWSCWMASLVILSAAGPGYPS
jgi:hypothetical protein